MTIARSNPPLISDERPMLDAWLDFHRATLLMKCEGLSAVQLRERAVPPSTLCLLGLVRHLTGVERRWFQIILSGADVPRYDSVNGRDGEFNDVETADPEETFAAFRAQCDRSRVIAAAAPSLDTAGRDAKWGEVSLRWIMLHLIEEYARHNGHADFLRERIDGSVGA